MLVHDCAQKLLLARKNHELISALTDSHPELSVEEAYQVQDILLEEALGRGEEVVGYKMGLTSRAKQNDVGVFASISGFLLGSGIVDKGQSVSSKRFLQPKVEPEIAVVLGDSVENRFQTLASIRSLVEFIGPAAEILDSRYQDYRFKLPDVIADNTSAGGFILGSSNWVNNLDEIRLMGVQVKVQGQLVDTGAPAATFGDPLISVLELSRELARRGKKLLRGQVILTGGLTAAPRLEKGTYYEMVWPGETIGFSYV